MPIRAILSSKLISIGTSFFVLLGSGHYNLNKPEPKVQQTAETVVTTSVDETPKEEQINLTATTISVSCIKLEWNGNENMQYTVTAFQSVCDDYINNIYFEIKI